MKFKFTPIHQNVYMYTVCMHCMGTMWYVVLLPCYLMLGVDVRTVYFLMERDGGRPSVYCKTEIKIAQKIMITWQKST